MAAGLGFKTFNTGDVLSAADTNGYLMQGVLVFASAAARDAAITSPQEGQCCYLKDTDAVQTYSGTALVGFDDSNAIQNAIVDAKGDIVAASGNDTPARLAVGNNGDTLVADSSATTGLRWTENYAAGKNKIINGDFNINQRNFTTATAAAYGFDRWRFEFSTGTNTYSAQTFTPGTAPVAGYEAKNFAQMAISGQSATSAYNILGQRIEDVRTFAGQTVTFSFWAKASSGTPSIGLEITQVFGSGGSPSAFVSTPLGSITTSTSWARYSKTVAVPSISGKTIGTDANSSYIEANFWLSAGSDHATRASSIGINNSTFQIWGVQVEDGSVATAFNTATGTIQGELAACQRYYQRFTSDAAYGLIATGKGFTTGNVQASIPLKVTMRVAPTAIDTSAAGTFIANTGATDVTSLTSIAINANLTSSQYVGIDVNKSAAFTVGAFYFLYANNATTSFIGASAEL
jgi:hypothetical protein